MHYTTLIPEAAEPSMYLITALVEPTASDGTVVPVFERPFLTCKPPER